MHVCVYVSGMHYVFDQIHGNSESIQDFVFILILVTVGAKMKFALFLCRGFREGLQNPGLKDD